MITNAEYSLALAAVPQVSYLTTDHLGSPRVITNESGAVTKRQDYTAFGEETVTTERTSRADYTGPKENRQDYTGYQKDEESGLEYSQARYYNSGHGRFTSVDPLTASAAIKNPQTFNRYSYALNSPYKFTDPLGLAADHSGPARNRDLDTFLSNTGGATLVSEYPNDWYGYSNSVVAATSGGHGGNPGGSHGRSRRTSPPASPAGQNVGDTGIQTEPIFWRDTTELAEVDVDASYGITVDDIDQIEKKHPDRIYVNRSWGLNVTLTLRDYLTGNDCVGYRYTYESKVAEDGVESFFGGFKSDPNVVDVIEAGGIKLPSIDFVGGAYERTNIPNSLEALETIKDGKTLSQTYNITFYGKSGTPTAEIKVTLTAVKNGYSVLVTDKQISVKSLTTTAQGPLVPNL